MTLSRWKCQREYGLFYYFQNKTKIYIYIILFIYTEQKKKEFNISFIFFNYLYHSVILLLIEVDFVSSVVEFLLISAISIALFK